MTQDNSTVGDSPSLSAPEYVDSVCDRFEAAWRAGRRPRIEDYLAEAPGPARGMLLQELLALEIDLRFVERENPSPEEYQRRFPGRVDVIKVVFAQASRDDSGRPPDSVEGATTPHSPPAHKSAGDAGPPLLSGSPPPVPDCISRRRLGIAARRLLCSGSALVGRKRPDIASG
jgi:hypothetical protein